MTNLIDPSTVDYNKDFSIMYVDPFNSKYLAMNLLTFGITQFKRSKRILEFKLFAELQRKQSLNEIYEFAICNINDTIRIAICFENFMKAVLLLNNCIVHIIKNDQLYKPLNRKQKEEPVFIRELREIQDFEFTSTRDVKVVLPGIVNKTIGMGTMLSKAYQKIIYLPNDILDIVSSINQYRNNLHFYVKEELLINPENIRDLERLSEFVETAIVPLFHDVESYIVKNGNQ